MPVVTTELAVEALREARLVVFPTETVYGIGADAFNADAVAEVFAIKKRAAGKPMSLHLTSVEMARDCVSVWTDEAERLARRFWPGPLTLVMKSSPRVPLIVRAGGDTVGLRAPDHDVFRALVDGFGQAIVGTSANLSGSTSPVTLDEVPAEIRNDPRVVSLDGGRCTTGIESTVIALHEDGAPFTMLREGAISRDEIESA